MDSEQRLDWCKVHDSKAATPLVNMGKMGKVGMCQHYSLSPSKELERCEFISAVLVISAEAPDGQ